jgi:excisionase family DNA binding protein
MPTRRNNGKLKPLLSVEETAILLGETRSTIYRAVKAGTLPLPVFRIGSRIRIPRRAVECLIAGIVPEGACTLKPTGIRGPAEKGNLTEANRMLRP